MGYQHRLYRTTCGNCGTEWLLTLKTWEKVTCLPQKYTCDSCGAHNQTKNPSLHPNIPRVLYCGNERNKQLEIYPYPPHREGSHGHSPLRATSALRPSPIITSLLHCLVAAAFPSHTRTPSQCFFSSLATRHCSSYLPQNHILAPWHELTLMKSNPYTKYRGRGYLFAVPGAGCQAGNRPQFRYRTDSGPAISLHRYFIASLLYFLARSFSRFFSSDMNSCTSLKSM